MKKTAILKMMVILVTMLCSLSQTSAQTLTVTTSSGSTQVEASEAGTMTYDSIAGTITIGGSDQQLVVYTSSTPSLKSGVTVSGGTEYFGGMGNVGGTVSGGSSVTLSTYTGGGSGPGGGPGWH